jgi:hypothetical protein
MLTQCSNQQFFIVGDCSPTKTYFFSHEFISLVKQHACSILNLEGVFSEEQTPLFKAGPHLLLEKQLFLPFAKLFTTAVLANNHSMDFGVEGLETTIATCTQLGIDTVGAGMNQKAAFTPVTRGKTQIFAVAEHEFGGANELSPGVATTDKPLLLYQGIQEAKQSGHFVVVIAHGGSEVIPVPPPYLRERYRLWIEYGADVVIGNHPHVVQGRECYKGRYIYYSLGNFAFPGDSFGQYHYADWSLGLSIDPDSGAIEEFSIISVANRITISSDPYYKDQLELLSAVLRNELQYKAIYNQIAADLFVHWYPRMMPQSLPDAALLLHYLRCDAHSSMITSSLSSLIGEPAAKETTTDRWKLLRHQKNDAFWLFDQRNCPQLHLDEYASLMQMSADEAAYLSSLITAKSYLEIGMGYSTLYFSCKAKTMVSVESRRPWYSAIRQLLHFHGITNVTARFLPPEKCAFDSQGNEVWVTRIHASGAISDYGQQTEFESYLTGVSSILAQQIFDVILVDGQVRQEVVAMLIKQGFRGEILLHDVTPDRDYLNIPILSLHGIKKITQVDSLVHLRCSHVSDIMMSGNTLVPSQDTIIFESDWLASSPYFYNERTGKHSSNINDVIDYNSLQLHPEGFLNYLDFGYSVFEQTPVADVKFMPHSSRLYQTSKGKLRLERMPDPVLAYLGKQTDPVDVFDRLISQVHTWEQSTEGPIIIPTSGGFDSRLLNLLVQDKNRISTYSYGISKKQYDSSEVVKAQELARVLGTKWKRVHLGAYNRFIPDWLHLFGVSTHAHGMYHFEFYDAIASEQPAGTHLLSGIIGDAWAGCSSPYPTGPDELTVLGYSHGLRLNPSCSTITSGNPLREEYWENHKELLKDPAYRVVAMIRNKMILLSYLMKLPRYFGFNPWSPFLDIGNAMGMLNLPQAIRNDRLWQRTVFAANGVDFEEQDLSFSTENYLDTEMARNEVLPPLDLDLINKLFKPEIVEMITTIATSPEAKQNLTDQQINACYVAYVMLAPLAQFTGKHK